MTITASRYLIRPMTVDDIPRVSEIERESFPTMWPQTAYKRELQRNNLAAYLVLSELPDTGNTGDCPQQAQESNGSSGERRPAPRLRRFLRRVGSLLTESPPERLAASVEMGERILGFVGLWFMVDETHIVTIAVAEAARRRGLGEMLLIAAIELATLRQQEVVTLECRVSNTGAQALYEKYGFRRVGVRKRYYTDNDEDALIMTTFPIQGDEFKTRFEQLRSASVARHGAPQVAHPELAS